MEDAHWEEEVKGIFFSSDCIVASLFITESLAHCAVGAFPKQAESIVHRGGVVPPTVRIVRDHAFNNPSNAPHGHKAMERIPEETLNNCLQWILDQSPNGKRLEAICIGCFGPFRSATEGHPDYGVLADISSHKDWSNADILGIAKAFMSEHGYPDINVTVHTEVELAALGEYWHTGRRLIQRGQDSIERHRRDERAQRLMSQRVARDIRKSSLVFVKVSRSINGGIARGGEIWQGHHHTSISITKSRRYSLTVKDQNSTYTVVDDYPGCCEFHGDCIEGLVGLTALEERTRVSFENIEPNDIVWDMVAYYLARLAVMVTAIVAPTRIVFGGKIIEDYEQPERLMASIRRHFRDAITGGERRVPHYPNVSSESQFIRLRGHRAPGSYGGLIIAERATIAARRPGPTVWADNK